MNDRDNRLPDRVRTISRLLTGGHQPSRGVRLLVFVLGRIFEQGGGKVTGKAIFAALIVLVVVVLGFVAYRLVVLELILRLVEDR
ncbi:hypothetical protein ACI2K4_24430 [Micromonospora sp. NPDC050397]|uniref:hypothetical protein n=1 Tax=Micromonospora sp. NPDC050397 TaxID=3364279 RepID=UPI00384F9238